MAAVLTRTKWQIWRDVIFSLVVREIKTGFNDKLGLSWAIVNPVAFIFILSFARGRLDGGETYTMPTFVFMAYGMILIQLFLQVFQNCSGAVKKSQPLFAFRQVQPISPVIASFVFEFTVKIFVILGIGLVMYFLNMPVMLDDPLLFIRCVILVGLIAMGLGLAFGTASLFIPELTKLQNLLTRPMFFISGVFFSLRDFPPDYWYLLDWNPILHAIELSRFAAYSSYGDIGVDEVFLWEVTFLILFFSLLLYRATWKQAVSK